MHIEQFAHKIAHTLLSFSPPTNIIDPEGYLRTLYPEKQNSCLMENEVDADPPYDVLLVIPVYNAEKYLKDCVESIIQQRTHYRYKAVFVNDGSTDGSRPILEHYANFPSVSIVTTTNGGPSKARNTALRHIDARYVMFADADDLLAPNAIETLVSKADELNADIVEGNHVYFSGNKQIYTSTHIDDFQGGNIHLYGVLWGKVYKAEIWKHVGIPINYWYEDTVDWMVVYQMPLKKATIKEVVYFYRSTPTGFSKGFNRNPRRVETYWVTKQLLSDAHRLGLQFSDDYYSLFLRQCNLNTHRVAILGDRRADYALFQAHRKLQDEYFKGMHTTNQQVKPIEQALLTNNFKEYMLYCLFLFK